MFKDKEIIELLNNIYKELRQIKLMFKGGFLKNTQKDKNIKGEE